VTKVKRAVRRERWLIRLQAVRFWLWCLVGVAVSVMLPGLKYGIQDIALYTPTLLELGVAMLVALLAVVIDEKLTTDKLIKSKSVMMRKRKHAVVVGLAAMGTIRGML